MQKWLDASRILGDEQGLTYGILIIQTWWKVGKVDLARLDEMNIKHALYKWSKKYKRLGDEIWKMRWDAMRQYKSYENEMWFKTLRERSHVTKGVSLSVK